MNEDFDSAKKIGEDIEFEALVDFPVEEEDSLDVVRDAVSGGIAARMGIQTNSLQAAIDNYARAMNQAAIAKTTGLPVKTPTQQYKGFAAEEYFKNTMKINALAKGIPDSKIGIYTKGTLPDGTNLSGIDMEVDISVWTREHPWNKPMRSADYQAKIHNDASAYAKDMNNPQYKDVQFVGGEGQGVNATVKVEVNGQTVASDAITPEEAAKLADQMKAQDVPEYTKKQEKFDELNKVNLIKAVEAGAMTGFIVSTVREIIDVIKHHGDDSETQFIQRIENILCGTVEGGVRSGGIALSVQMLGKVIGKEVAANSLEAVPVMAAANTVVDLAKDLYKCFITQTIDMDDLLCNSMNNAFSSAAGFGGAWAMGQLGGQMAEALFASAQAAAEAGAAIGSSAGPIGTVIGSVVGGIVIGIGANAIIGTAEKDAVKAYKECIDDINSHIELSGCEKLYYFADSMASLSEFRLSFKDLLPCYNLISDLREYNLHKKAIREVGRQLEEQMKQLEGIETRKREALQELERRHQQRLSELETIFAEQRQAMQDDFRESVKAYVADSYMRYLDVYNVLEGDVNALIEEVQNSRTEHSWILNYMRNRNKVNEQLNETLRELMKEGDGRLLKPFIDEMSRFIQQDELMAGCQYISFEEALYLVDGGDHGGNLGLRNAAQISHKPVSSQGI